MKLTDMRLTQLAIEAQPYLRSAQPHCLVTGGISAQGRFIADDGLTGVITVDLTPHEQAEVRALFDAISARLRAGA